MENRRERRMGEGTMTGPGTYRMKGKVVLRRMGEDRLLVPVSGSAAQENCVFPLNETGVFIWERLSVSQPMEEVAQALAQAFAVSVEDARADCREYADALLTQQLLEEGTP